MGDIAMKRILQTAAFCLTVLFLLCLFGCGDDGRVFVIKGNSMSDGTVTYVRFPEKWYYFGKYSYRIGTVQEGNALLASDEEGTFVRERKPLLADMEYAPWVRSDFRFPVLDEESDEMDIEISIYRQWDSLILSEQAKSEFIEWARKVESGEIRNKGKNYGQSFASVYYSFPNIPNLRYDPKFYLIHGYAGIVVVDSSGNVIGNFGSDTAFCKEIA